MYIFFCHFLKGFFFFFFFFYVLSYQIGIIFIQVYETLTSETTTGQSEAGSNSNEGVLYTLQNLNLTLRCSLVSYLEYPFSGGGGSYLSTRDIVNIF